MRPAGVLTLTHSSRETNLDRCSVQFLTRRFSDPARLADLPSFDSLPPAPTLYSGAVSFFLAFDDGTGRLHLRRLGSVRSRDRIQHAAVLPGGDVVIGFEHRVVRWRPRLPIPELPRVDAMDFQVSARFEHTLLAGLHTVEPLGEDKVAIAFRWGGDPLHARLHALRAVMREEDRITVGGVEVHADGLSHAPILVGASSACPVDKWTTRGPFCGQEGELPQGGPSVPPGSPAYPVCM